MTKSVTIIITSDDTAAASATARRVVNTLDNIANWANTNQPGKIRSIKAVTRDVTVVSTGSDYSKDGSGNLVKVT